MPFLESRAYTYYKSVVCQDMIYTRNLKNIMELPEIVQCALNTSSASIVREKTRILAACVALQTVSMQKSKTNRSRHSIAAFNLRRGGALGCAVKLRGRALYSFLDQYVTLVFPRKDVMGVQGGGFPLVAKGKTVGIGVQNFTSFPELEAHFLMFSPLGGYNCTFCTSTKSAAQAALLLTAFQFPCACPATPGTPRVPVAPSDP